MSVVIDDTPYPRFPITPREGLMLTIGGQKRVIDHIEVSLDTLEVRCDTRPWVPPVTKPEQDQPVEEPPAKTNAEEPESTDGTRATTKKVPREQRGKA